jgi:hypothetical protein
MAIYTYSLADDTASGSVILNKLQNEIDLQISGVTHINLSGDNIDIHSSSDLSAGDQTTLTTIVSNHNGVELNLEKAPKMIQQIDVNKSSKTQNNYVTMSKIIYYGAESIGEIQTIEVIAYMESNATSFDIKIVDKKNSSNVIAEKTGLTNTIDEIIDMGTISNLPSKKSRLEIQIRKNGSNKSAKVYLDTVLVKY